MTTRLPPTDVVVIGLGGAGGVAVEPLAAAGLKVVGLEAGTRLAPRDFAPDELRNNFRGWPHAAQKANREIPVHRPNAAAPDNPRAAIHPMMNGVGGTTLHYWAQSWRLNPVGLQGRQRDDAPLRRGARPARARPSRTGRSGSRSSSRTTTRSSTRSACRARPATSRARSIARGNIFEGARARPYPMPPLRGTEFTELMASAAAAARLASVPRARPPINSQVYQNRSACLYHGFCNRGGCHVSAKNSTAVSTIPRAEATGNLTIVTEAHVTRIDVDARRARSRRAVPEGRRDLHPAGGRRAARGLHVREHAAACCCRRRRRIRAGLANNRGQVGRHYFTHNQGGGVLALFPHQA